MIKLAAIFLGGGLGALSRYGFGVFAFRVLGSGFPYGTLAVNILGSLLMGVLIEVFARFWQPSLIIQVLFITGFLGAFTTFSTFSLDVVTLYQRGEMAATLIYLVLSVVLSISALVAGLYLMRQF